jgi:hypothetical protein
VASYDGAQTSALIPLKNNGAERQSAKLLQGAAGDKEVAQLLASN